MRRKLLLLICSFACITSAIAQYGLGQNKVWAFGYGAGVNFASGTPVPFNTNISTNEGSASVADASGNLLFYTDGRRVWNSTGGVMPGGSAIVTFTTSSSTQGSLILPVLGDPNRYYIFSLENVSGGSGGMDCRLSSTIIDMTLDGGNGDVVTGTAGIPLDNRLAEKMIAIPGNSCNIWLIVHRKDSTIFRAYEITTSGISSTPVVSSVGGLSGGSYGYGIGVLKGSPNRQRILSQCYNFGGGIGTELYDFNPTTGIVSNCRVLDNTTNQYGGEFSPDNSKIYTHQSTGGAGLYQYDISLGSTAAMAASKTLIQSGGGYPDLKLACDNKIYLVSLTGSGFLDCISNPNASGSACGFVSHAVTLASGSSCGLGMPNMFVMVGVGDTTYTSHDTVACIPTGGSITVAGHGTGTSYLWYDGATTSTHTVSSYGSYWVGILDGCTITFDTIHVLPPPPTSAIYKHDTSLCESVGPYLLAGHAGFTHYFWNDATTSATLTVNTTGTYWVRAYDDCDNEIIDTFHVRFIPIDSSYYTFNLSLCQGADGITLNASPGLDAYVWQDGTTTGTVFNATTGGTYYVVGTSFCKVNIDSFYVSPKDLTFSLGNDTTICVAYQLVSPLIDSTYTYLWQDGYTGPTNFINNSGNYILTIKYGNCTSSDTINVQFENIAQNIRDTFICKGEPINVVVNATLFPGGSVLWNDGSTNPTKVLRDSGIYWVFVSKKECMILDTIRVNTGYCNCWHNVPQAFTPNNDGLNDVIKPKIEPGCNISGYQFVIYNRWGEEVFKTDFRDKGWDGTYKGQPADMGVYMYSLQFYKGVSDIPVIISGDITLIR